MSSEAEMTSEDHSPSHFDDLGLQDQDLILAQLPPEAVIRLSRLNVIPYDEGIVEFDLDYDFWLNYVSDTGIDLIDWASKQARTAQLSGDHDLTIGQLRALYWAVEKGFILLALWIVSQNPSLLLDIDVPTAELLLNNGLDLEPLSREEKIELVTFSNSARLAEPATLEPDEADQIVKYSDLDTLGELIERGLDLSKLGDEGTFRLVERSSSEELAELFDDGLDLSKFGSNNRVRLMTELDEEKLLILMNNGLNPADLEWTDVYSLSAARLAESDISRLRLLVDRGLSFENMQLPSYELRELLEKSDTEKLRFLIDHGFRPDFTAFDDYNTVELIKRADIDLLRLLVANGLELSTLDRRSVGRSTNEIILGSSIGKLRFLLANGFVLGNIVPYAEMIRRSSIDKLRFLMANGLDLGDLNLDERRKVVLQTDDIGKLLFLIDNGLSLELGTLNGTWIAELARSDINKLRLLFNYGLTFTANMARYSNYNDIILNSDDERLRLLMNHGLRFDFTEADNIDEIIEQAPDDTWRLLVESGTKFSVDQLIDLVTQRSLEQLQSLIDVGLDLRLPELNPEQTIRLISSVRSIEKLAFLIDNGLRLDLGRLDSTQAQLLAMNNSVEELRFLFDNGLTFNAPPIDGYDIDEVTANLVLVVDETTGESNEVNQRYDKYRFLVDNGFSFDLSNPSWYGLKHIILNAPDRAALQLFINDLLAQGVNLGSIYISERDAEELVESLPPAEVQLLREQGFDLSRGN